MHLQAGKRAPFGTRGSQVQILPLRPTHQNYSADPAKLAHKELPKNSSFQTGAISAEQKSLPSIAQQLARYMGAMTQSQSTIAGLFGVCRIAVSRNLET